MAAKTTRTRKPTARKLPSYDARVASKIAEGMNADTAARQAQIEVWAARHNVSYNHAYGAYIYDESVPGAQYKAIVADHTEALKVNARQAKIDAMAAVEDFEIETAGMQRAFDDLCTHYSEGNAMLILAQAAALGLKVRGLRDVGGFQTMQERGRAVVKGQHQAFFIWGRKIDRNAEGETAPENLPLPENTNSSEAMRKARSFYPIVGLFHISQTEDLEKAKARWAAEKAAK